MIRNLKTCIITSIIYIAVMLLISPTLGFVVDHIDYKIDYNGNALVTADYTMSLGERIALMVPTVKDQFTNIIKSEYGQNAQVISISDNHAQFTIPDYASKTDTYIQTPCISFDKIKTRADQYWFMKYMDVDYSPTLTTITFPNNEITTYNDVMFIPATTIPL